MEKKFIGSGLKESGPNRNVLNALRVLLEDQESIIYLPTTTYERGSRSRIDDSVHHGMKEAPTMLRVTDFVSNMERFNFSVRGLKDIMVENEDHSLEPKKVFRTYTIIRDGKLILDEIDATLSCSSYMDLAAAGIIYDQKGRRCDPMHEQYTNGYIYSIHLSELPLVSDHWAQPNQIGLFDYMADELFLSDYVKVLNNVKKKYVAAGQADKFDGPDEIYHETSSYKEEDPQEFYEVDCVEYRLKKFQYAVPTEEMVEAVFPRLEDIKKKLIESKKTLSYDRFIIRAVIFSIENTKKKGSFEWSDAVKLPRSKNKMVQSTDVMVGEIPSVLERITWKESIAR